MDGGGDGADDDSSDAPKYESDNEMDMSDMESTSNPSWLEKIQQTVRKFLQAVNPFQTPVDTYESESVRKDYDDASGKLSKIQSRISSLTKKLGHDFGPEKEFYSLYGQCFETKQNKYVYKVCPFKEATQVEGHSRTHRSWDKFAESYRVMLFTSGDKCWNGPYRSLTMSRKVVQNVHLSGGSLLGVSRGGPNVSEIVDSMGDREINMLFVLGGNGTHAGANAIHNEAHSAYRGIGVVKLMGWSSGFIAMHASLASGQIDLCLIPEVPFELNGPHGVLSHLKYLLETKGSAVICVAEGAGQNFVEKTNAKDASGNVVLGDIGVHIQQEMANIHNIPFNIPRVNGKSRKTSPTRAVEYL